MLRIAVFLLSACAAFAQYGVARKVITGPGAPSSTDCDSSYDVGNVYARNNAGAAYATLYVCANTAVTTYTWELYSNSGGGGSGTVGSGSAGSVAWYQSTGTAIEALSTAIDCSTSRCRAGSV